MTKIAVSSMQHAVAPAAAAPSSWSGRSWTTPPCLGDDDPPPDTLEHDLAASLAVAGLCHLIARA